MRLFTKPFFVAVAAVIGLGAGMTAMNASVQAADIEYTYPPDEMNDGRLEGAAFGHKKEFLQEKGKNFAANAGADLSADSESVRIEYDYPSPEFDDGHHEGKTSRNSANNW